MHTITILKDGKDQIIQLPTSMAYEGVTELEISRKRDVITLRPVRPTWRSLVELPKAATNHLCYRPVIIDDEGRFAL